METNGKDDEDWKENLEKRCEKRKHGKIVWKALVVEKKRFVEGF